MGDFNEILDGREYKNYTTSPSILVGMREFQEAARYCSMIDMSYHGPLFTRCNKRDEGMVCKKLDRVLMNDVWMHQFPQVYCVFEPGGCSNHLRCRIQFDDVKEKKHRSFKFTNAVAKTSQFIPVVGGFWNETYKLFHSTSAMHRFSKKLKALKALLRKLSKEKLAIFR